MANLSKKTTALRPGESKKKSNKGAGKSPVKAKGKKVRALGGGDATKLKAKSELFLTAISTFAGEDTHYESGQKRIDRIVDLTHKVTKKDPDWVERFVAWLRGPDANIRTASIIIAAEYVFAGGPNKRQVIASVCQRADEPAEMLAWWMERHYGWTANTYPLPSPKLPQGLRKGLADACRNLYNEYSAMKYSGGNRGVGMADVLNLVHPAPKDDAQGHVFQYIIDRAYGNEVDVSELPMIAKNHELRDLKGEKFKKHLNSDELKQGGLTWEQVGSYLDGAWTAEAWEAVIPSMGYMALLRNLRNFEQAGIPAATRKKVNDIISDPERVAKSRQLPFRFLSAYKNTGSSHYLSALEDALDASVKNIPAFDGNTLVLVDKSGSMSSVLSAGGRRQMGNRPLLWEVGALFGVALALKGENTDIAIFGDRSKRIELPNGSSVLRAMEKLSPNNGVGHGTDIQGAIDAQYADHDRVVIFTDIQPNYAYGYYGRSSKSPMDNPHIPFIHYFDIGGYGQGSSDLTKAGRFQYGGFTDSTFKLMAMLEDASGDWPF